MAERPAKMINEAWEIIETSIIIALSGVVGWALTKLIKGYFRNIDTTIEKQGELLDDIRNGKVKVMYQQPEICRKFMKGFEEESEKQDGRLMKVEKIANHNSDEIEKINGRLDNQEKNQENILLEIGSVKTEVGSVKKIAKDFNDKWKVDRKNRDSLTESSLNMVVAFNKNSQAVEDHSIRVEELGKKLLEILGEKNEKT